MRERIERALLSFILTWVGCTVGLMGLFYAMSVFDPFASFGLVTIGVMGATAGIAPAIGVRGVFAVQNRVADDA